MKYKRGDLVFYQKAPYHLMMKFDSGCHILVGSNGKWEVVDKSDLSYLPCPEEELRAFCNVDEDGNSLIEKEEGLSLIAHRLLLFSQSYSADEKICFDSEWIRNAGMKRKDLLDILGADPQEMDNAKVELIQGGHLTALGEDEHGMQYRVKLHIDI